MKIEQVGRVSRTIQLLLAGLLALLLFHRAHADMPKLEYAFDAALAADMLTTNDIRYRPGMYETNPVLGRRPGGAAILAYGLGCAVLHAVVTHEMVSQGVPAPIVDAWEYVSIGVETAYAAHNYSIGLRFKF